MNLSQGRVKSPWLSGVLGASHPCTSSSSSWMICAPLHTRRVFAQGAARKQCLPVQGFEPRCSGCGPPGGPLSHNQACLSAPTLRSDARLARSSSPWPSTIPSALVAQWRNGRPASQLPGLNAISNAQHMLDARRVFAQGAARKQFLPVHGFELQSSGCDPPRGPLSREQPCVPQPTLRSSRVSALVPKD